MYSEQLRYLPFFKGLDTGLLSKLAEHSYLKHYEKGQLLFLHGDVTKYFYIISSGWLKLFRDTLDGQEAFLGLATTGDLIGEIDFNKKLHLFSAKAVNETELLLLPQDILKESIEDNGALALKVIKALNSTISLLELQLEHASTMNAAQRIGCFILRLFDSQQEKIKITLPYDKTLIASYLGMKRETFSRGLHDLKLVGVTVDGHILSVDNIQELINFSCVSCSLIYDSCKE
jgi:CRP-like cAMP-binding protein